MTRAALTFALMALIAGCGKYGPPVRESAAGSVSGVTAGHPAGCQDPDHHHGADTDAGDGPDQAGPEEAP
jgi:hypothetical protein